MLTSLPRLDSAFVNHALTDSPPAVLPAPLQIWEEADRSPPSAGPDDDVRHRTSGKRPKKKKTSSSSSRDVGKPAEPVMNSIEPEDELLRLVENQTKLNLSCYYYGNLSWVDASLMLRKCKVGTFLVRDSEHCSYLYTLSVQTKKGPTSCRIDYTNGRFRLDSSKELSHKMPLFESVPYLIDYYVRLSSKPCKGSSKAFSPVWLDMDEENSRDVPVQIYRPLYRRVRSLQHMSRVAVVRGIRERDSSAHRALENPTAVVCRSIERDPEYKGLPKLISDYLTQYPCNQ